MQRNMLTFLFNIKVYRRVETTKAYVFVFVVGLWFLTPLSTIFQFYRGGFCICKIYRIKIKLSYINFLFTNLFSIKFLYFLIISSLFPYFNLFVSIFIQSYVNIKLHVSTLIYIDTNNPC